MKALVVKTTGLWYEVLAENEKRIARLRGKFKQRKMETTNPVAVGDWVEIEESTQISGEWVITDMLDRENYVARQSPRKKHLDHLVAANIDQALIFFTFKYPRTSTGFLDRILVTLEAFRIPAIILLNKLDLCTDEDKETWQALSYFYEALGYQTHRHHQEMDVQPILDKLEAKTTLLVGHSGTGKSTLINQVVPGAKQDIGEISSFADKGTHTTTFAEMFFVNEQTRLIDTPGIKELGLTGMEPGEIAHYFPEMREHLGECKFHNCLHTEEPGCVVKDRVTSGDIAFFRYESYLSMLLTDDNRR